MLQAQTTTRRPRTAAASTVNGIFTAIFRDVQEGKVPLPSLPHLALSLRTVARDKSAGFNELSRVLQGDPGVASFVLKMANSATFGSRYPAENLNAAINRLGTRTMVNAVTAYSLRNLFRSNSAVLREVLRQIWAQSAELAATCAVIARRITHQDADRAMLGGLLANIGALPLINAAPARLDVAANPGVIEQAIKQFSRQVGVMMLSAWDFDPALIDIVRNREVWHHTGGPEPDLTDLVNVATLLIRKSREVEFAPPALRSVPSVIKFVRTWPGVDWTPTLIGEIAAEVDDAKDQMTNG